MSNSKNMDLTRVTEIFKALANTNRLKIFLRLRECCVPSSQDCHSESDVGCCVGDLGSNADIAPSTLSHHIKELSRSGLIQLERRGQNIHCQVNQSTAEAVDTFLDAIENCD